MQIQTTLVEHKPQQMNGSNGAWTLHKFKAADGNWYEIGKTDIANAAYALMQSGTAVLLTYEVKQNGQYTNNRVSAVQAIGAAGQAMAPGVTPVGAPNGAAPTTTPAAAPTTAPTSGNSYRPTAPEDAQRMSRSKGLDQALKAAESGIVVVESLDQLFDVAGAFARYAYSGSRPGASTAPSSSGAGGGESAGAPQAAPVAEAAPVAQQPEQQQQQTVPTADDIPF